MRRVELFELIRKDCKMDSRKERSPESEECTAAPFVRRSPRRSRRARARPKRNSPRLTSEVKGFIDGILIIDRNAPRKQRHTAKRIWKRTREELSCPAAETTVRRYVAIAGGS